VLVVDGSRQGPVLSTVAITNAAPTYASGGRVLVTASALGLHDDRETERRVRTHLSRMYAVSTDEWEHVATYAIPYALPAMLPPLDVRQPVSVGEGLFVAGDHRDTASIQGAMVSGRRAADAILHNRHS
jgi:predicted NAD/FAD-dependent oxidoreductase